MGRVTWKQELLKTQISVLRGYLGDIPAYTVRLRADGKFALTDRLQQEFGLHDTEAGAQKDAEHRVERFLERIGADFRHQVYGTQTGRVPRSLSATRRKVLQNVADGNELYHEMSGPERETAVHYVAHWRELPSLIRHVGVGSPLELTDAGRKALETGEY